MQPEKIFHFLSDKWQRKDRTNVTTFDSVRAFNGHQAKKSFEEKFERRKKVELEGTQHKGSLPI